MIGLALSPEQFKVLLRMVFIANTVANGNREDEEILKEYDELEQYVFARAKESGLPGATLTHQVGDVVHHHPSRAFEHDPEVNKIMDEYEAVLLFEVLSRKLAERAIEKKLGPNAKDRMPAKDFEDLLEEESEDYQKLLLDDGYMNIIVEMKE